MVFTIEQTIDFVLEPFQIIPSNVLYGNKGLLIVNNGGVFELHVKGRGEELLSLVNL